MGDLVLKKTTTGQITLTPQDVAGNQTVTIPASTGTLSIANTSTSGGIFFGGASSGVLYQDASNLYWDDTNNRLGIGTNSPSSELSVNGLASFSKGTSNGITIGDVSTNSNAQLRLQGTSAGNNFLLANNFNVSGFEITPSTATGGTTYSNPVYSVTGAGLHKWYYGTTNSMTLDASGNLGVNVSSPGSKLHVEFGANPAVDNGGGTNAIRSYTTITQAADVGGAIGLGGRYSTSDTSRVSFGQIAGRKENGTDGNLSGYLQFCTLFSQGTMYERARITSAGNFLLGTTTVSGSTAAFLTIGGTSDSSRVLPRTDNVGYVGDSGQRWQAIYAVNGTIQTSDANEKNNIVDSNLGLAFINDLRPVSYKWNVGENIVTYGEDGNEIATPRPGIRTHYGLIAQEVKSAIPEGVDFGGFVQEPDDGVMSLRYHEFISPMIKAIQELSAKNDALEARLAALEGAN